MNVDVSKLDWTQPEFNNDYSNAINELGRKLDSSDLKAELIQYARTIGREDDAYAVPAKNVSTAGKIAYCLNRGAKLEDRSVQKILDMLDNSREKTDVEPISDELPESARSKFLFNYTTCTGLIDNAISMAISGRLDVKNIGDEVRNIIRKYGNGKAQIIKQLERDYQENFEEIKKDPIVKSWSKPTSLVLDVLQLMSNSGKTKIKKNKLGGAIDRKGAKAASKVTYNTADVNLGINSAHPQSVVGASVAVIFNTKNRHCEVYQAKAGEKLSIQGARITNFDEKLSIGKTLRNPEESLPHFSKAGNLRRLEVLMSGVNGKVWELTGKLNKNTLILKVLQ